VLGKELLEVRHALELGAEPSTHGLPPNLTAGGEEHRQANRQRADQSTSDTERDWRAGMVCEPGEG
jgi:hypothetical protein